MKLGEKMKPALFKSAKSVDEVRELKLREINAVSGGDTNDTFITDDGYASFEWSWTDYGGFGNWDPTPCD